MSLRIAVTDTLKPNLENYLGWLKRYDAGIEFHVLSHVRKNLPEIGSAQGLLLTGGGDVDPKFYGAESAAGQVKDMDRQRDEFEFYVMEKALERDLPVLGICRGMQVMNVYLGGSLITDLPTAGYQGHAPENKIQIAHEIDVEPDSLLHDITGADYLKVNSSHHQAVDRLGNGLMISARSADGVTEGAEWILKDRTPFLVLVQWHPERMEEDPDSPASKNIAERFIRSVKHQTT